MFGSNLIIVKSGWTRDRAPLMPAKSFAAALKHYSTFLSRDTGSAGPGLKAR